MSEENETVILDHGSTLGTFPKTGTNPGGAHPRHMHEVICKEGTQSVTLEPAADHPHRERYVRTEEKDEKGRAIFRMETA